MLKWTLTGVLTCLIKQIELFFFKEYYCSKETWKCESKFAFAGRAQCQDYKFTTWAAAVTQKMTKNSRQLVILYTEM